MKIVRKILNNIIGVNPFFVLGINGYCKYLVTIFFNIHQIFIKGDLKPIDKIMGKNIKMFTFLGNRFLFDCEFCDAQLKEETYSFGIVREIYIRNCYFKWHPKSSFGNAKIILDLGANRGAFSALMTSHAKFILSVECQKQYEPIIKHNFVINDFKNYLIESVFLGSGGKFESVKSICPLSMEELLKRHNIERVDFVKMDIEGSEFSVFQTTNWLHKVDAMTLEVHTQFGDSNFIINKLVENGFCTITTDENLDKTHDENKINFIYAFKESSRNSYK